jgi:phospholipid N-methyltransferase
LLIFNYACEQNDLAVGKFEPIPEPPGRVRVEASGRIWMNIPPARVWVYHKELTDPP